MQLHILYRNQKNFRNNNSNGLHLADSLWMMYLLGATLGKVMPLIPQGQCRFMVQFGMLPLGLLRMADTKLIIATNLSWANIGTSRLQGALLMGRVHVIFLEFLHLALVD